MALPFDLRGDTGQMAANQNPRSEANDFLLSHISRRFMAFWDILTRAGRMRRRLRTLLLPKKQESLFEIVTFGKIEEEAQRIAAKRHGKEIKCIFLFFASGAFTHVVDGPLLSEENYALLLHDLAKKHKKPVRSPWKHAQEAFEITDKRDMLPSAVRAYRSN